MNPISQTVLPVDDDANLLAGRRLLDVVNNTFDMQLPALDGYSATRTLRQSNYGGRIVALTAYARSTDREKCLNAGCDSYVSKPIQRQTLLAVLAKALATSTHRVAGSRGDRE